MAGDEQPGWLPEEEKKVILDGLLQRRTMVRAALAD
jgi:hypothetical protein